MNPRMGFTLVEALVCLALLLLLAAGLAAVLHTHRRIAQRQVQAADLQQSIRIIGSELARVVRVAGRGGLPGSLAVETRNDVAEGSRVGEVGTPYVRAGSDVLIVRGVFEGPLAILAGVDDLGGGKLTLTLHDRGPLGVEQALEGFVGAVESSQAEALLLAAESGAGFAIVELLGGAVVLDPASGQPGALTLTARLSGGEPADSFRRLAESVGETLDPARAERVGILAEYRFYARLSADPFSGDERFRLARARFYPGTDLVHPSSPGAGEDLVDHALDLQVALGFDLDGNGEIWESTDVVGRAVDEWLRNDAADDPAATAWAGADPVLVRVGGWLRSSRAQLGYVSRGRDRLEDRIYSEASAPSAEEVPERRFLRAEFQHLIRRRSP